MTPAEINQVAPPNSSGIRKTPAAIAPQNTMRTNQLAQAKCSQLRKLKPGNSIRSIGYAAKIAPTQAQTARIAQGVFPGQSKFCASVTTAGMAKRPCRAVRRAGSKARACSVQCRAAARFQGNNPSQFKADAIRPALITEAPHCVRITNAFSISVFNWPDPWRRFLTDRPEVTIHF